MVTPAPQLEDLSKATIALVTEDGVVLRGNPEKLESAWASKWVKLLKMLDTRGVILTWVGEGHSGVDVMMLCQKCESAGIKTVMLNSEMALTPDDPGFVHLVSEADAIVSTGNYEMKVDLPPVDRVLQMTTLRLELIAVTCPNLSPPTIPPRVAEGVQLSHGLHQFFSQTYIIL